MCSTTNRNKVAARSLRVDFLITTGGYEGLVEAQRFLWDCDGIVAGAPDMDEADLVMQEL